jgi:hypothetical protein
LNRNRLKRDRLVRASDQNVGTKSYANGSLRRTTAARSPVLPDIVNSGRCRAGL